MNDIGIIDNFYQSLTQSVNGEKVNQFDDNVTLGKAKFTYGEMGIKKYEF
jgi:hypothetical protein